jgi:tetratricopeptide (TPR) repeat protein
VRGLAISGIRDDCEASGRLRSGPLWIAGRYARCLSLICPLLLRVPASAEAQPPTSTCAKARPYITQAQAALAAGDSAAALSGLNHATEVDPRCAEAYLLLGLVEFHGGAIDESIQHYQRAVSLEPRSYSGHYDLALAYLKEHKLEEARTQLELAVSLDPRRADAAYDLGVLLLEMGDPSAALIKLRQARALDPQRADVSFNIVRAQLESGRVNEARTEAHESAKRFASDFQWNAAIGQLFLAKGQPKEAAPYLLQASRVRPEDAEIRHQLALAYLESGQADEVLETIPKAETSDDHYLRASAYYIAHRFPEADQESQLALAMAPENPPILILRARLLQRAGEQDEALVMAQKAITLAPNWDEPYYLAGVSYYFIRRYEQAEENLARAVELNPKSARALFLESIALANLGKVEDAERCLRQAIRLQPDDARLHCHLGILLARKNESQAAEDSFRKAIQLKPNYGLAHYELGKLLVSSKQLKPAAQELELAVKNDPSLTAAYYQLARVYTKLGETEKSQQALAEFEKLYQQEAHDSRAVDQALDDDARRATELR